MMMPWMQHCLMAGLLGGAAALLAWGLCAVLRRARAPGWLLCLVWLAVGLRFALPGGDGPKLRDYPVILEDGSQSAPGQFRDFDVYRPVGDAGVNEYHVITDAGFDRWVMEQSLSPETDGEPHLFALSKDGDTEAVCQEMAAVIEVLER